MKDMGNQSRAANAFDKLRHWQQPAQATARNCLQSVELYIVFTSRYKDEFPPDPCLGLSKESQLMQTRRSHSCTKVSHKRTASTTTSFQPSSRTNQLPSRWLKLTGLHRGMRRHTLHQTRVSENTDRVSTASPFRILAEVFLLHRQRWKRV